MNRKENILNRIATASDLPGEALPGIPLLELAGQHRILIENHKGVIAYGSTEISVKVAYGCISISGCNLELACMSKSQLVINGTISRIELFRGR